MEYIILLVKTKAKFKTEREARAALAKLTKRDGELAMVVKMPKKGKMK